MFDKMMNTALDIIKNYLDLMKVVFKIVEQVLKILYHLLIKQKDFQSKNLAI